MQNDPRTQALARTQTIATRALPEEKVALARIARQERRSPSEMLREMIRTEAQRRGLWPSTIGESAGETTQ